MGRCRDLWQKDQPELLELLIDRVRIVRNSEAHRRTQIDPRTQTVTFVNRRGNGKEEVLGPLNGMEFSRLFYEFWQLCLALHSTFQLLEGQLGATQADL